MKKPKVPMIVAGFVGILLILGVSRPAFAVSTWSEYYATYSSAADVRGAQAKLTIPNNEGIMANDARVFTYLVDFLSGGSGGYQYLGTYERRSWNIYSTDYFYYYRADSGEPVFNTVCCGNAGDRGQERALKFERTSVNGGESSWVWEIWRMDNTRQHNGSFAADGVYIDETEVVSEAGYDNTGVCQKSYWVNWGNWWVLQSGWGWVSGDQGYTNRCDSCQCGEYSKNATWNVRID